MRAGSLSPESRDMVAFIQRHSEKDTSWLAERLGIRVDRCTNLRRRAESVGPVTAEYDLLETEEL